MEPIRAIKIGEVAELQSRSKSLQRPVSQSRQDGLKLALAKMSLLRGEVIDGIRLESYSKALGEEFKEDSDTLFVLDRLVKSRRGEYEAKIPEMGDLLEMVRERRHERSREARDRKAQEEMAEYYRDQRENPEKYFSVQKIIAECISKKAAGAA